MNSKLVERCQARLQGLEIPRPFTVEAFCRSVSRHRGRPLHLHRLPDPTRFCGLWVATESADHVWYEPASSPFHRRHIILHELAHLICEHRLTEDDEVIRLLFPDLDPAMVVGVLARASYSTEQEQEAENLADIIMLEAGRSRREVTPEQWEAESDLDRLEERFG
jgi:hypothetical protein